MPLEATALLFLLI